MDYMREILYLRKVEQDIPINQKGYVILQWKKMTLSLLGSIMEKNTHSIYLLYENSGVLFPYEMGHCKENGTIDCFLKGEEMEKKGIVTEDIRGVFIGSKKEYYVGEMPNVKPGITYERIHFQEEQESFNAAEEKEQEEEQESKNDKNSEMYPFEDDEMEWCKQIAPADLALFPMECWHLSKNSFLLQGFYNYRHLLLCHGNAKDYVGVPGQYHRREQYLANRFGFPRFKGIKRKTCAFGDYGYWLRELL